jgi:hypothetical protein
MTNDPDLTQARFRKSTHSGSGDNCVEVASNLPGLVIVRDSKNPDGAMLTFSSKAWQAFLTSMR